jgi:hypothetical protein
MPFAPKDCACSVRFLPSKTLRCALMNAQTAVLTARTDRRKGPARKGIASFFKRTLRLKNGRKEERKMTERQHASSGELLRQAVEEPGRMLEAYTAFHNYSIGNALLALEQCVRRNLHPGPPFCRDLPNALDSVSKRDKHKGRELLPPDRS